MALEILRHNISGELYAATYTDGMSFDTLDGLVGPLTPREAWQAVCAGVIEADPADIPWAKEQSWTAYNHDAVRDLAERYEEGRST